MLRLSYTISERTQQNLPELAKLLDGDIHFYVNYMHIHIKQSEKKVSDIISMFMNLFALLLSNKFVVTMATATSQAQVLFL